MKFAEEAVEISSACRLVVAGGAHRDAFPTVLSPIWGRNNLESDVTRVLSRQVVVAADREAHPSDLRALTPPPPRRPQKASWGVLNEGWGPSLTQRAKLKQHGAAVRKTMAVVTKTRHPYVEGAPSAVRHRPTG